MIKNGLFQIVLSAINFLWHYILWKVNNLFPSETESEDIHISTEIAVNLMKKRDNIIEALSELVLDEAVSSNIRRNVRHFKKLRSAGLYFLYTLHLRISPSFYT